MATFAEGSHRPIPSLREKKPILVTSALPYANGSIHIGHLVEYIQTDIVVRALKQLGLDVIYCCADDTHGTPIQVKAEQLGITPQQLIEASAKEHLEDFSRYDIHFDYYGSTNHPENKYWSDFIFTQLQTKGLIYTKEVEQTYCSSCKRFLPDRFVKGVCPKCKAPDQYGDVCEHCNATYKPIELLQPYCSLCKSPPIRKHSLHYFFKLSVLAEELREYITHHQYLQEEVKRFILHWIDAGLEDWDISRDAPYFGFLIPGEHDKYYYVWLDAPIGYLSTTALYCKANGRTLEDYWQNPNSHIVHFIGKDIMYFHLLFWPAMLKHAGFKMPDDVVVHGFLTVQGQKMSKSRGTFLSARQLADLIDPELLRYYYAANLSRAVSDLDLDADDFVARINHELNASVFNFLYRTFSFTSTHFSGSVLACSHHPLLTEADQVLTGIIESYEHYELRDVVKGILRLSALGNKFFQDNEPWVLIKRDAAQAHHVVSICVHLCRRIIAALKPILPRRARALEEQLGGRITTFSDAFISPGHTLGTPKILLTKLEKVTFALPEHAPIASSATASKVQTPVASFSQLQLVVATVLDVRPHPAADKLLLLSVDAGNQQRQLVAGLKPYYQPHELLGKRIVVVANLKPANLRGYQSQGMLLAGDNGHGTVKIVEAPGAVPGDFVFLEGQNPVLIEHPALIDLSTVLHANLICKKGYVYYGTQRLVTSKGPLTLSMDDEGIVR
ncbi:MAG: methionine--tRNA ligase [Candidatus Woesearchaeota archaeon]